MSATERMVINLPKRCSHSQPVYHPCSECVSARVQSIAKMQKDEIAKAISEGNTIIKNQLKEAYASLQNGVDQSAQLQEKINQAAKERTRLLTIIREREGTISGLDIQMRAERRSKLKELDLSEVEV